LQEVPEQRQSKVSMVITNDDYDFLYKYSSLNRLVRIIAFCIRFINNTKVKTNRKLGHLSTQELNTANITIIKIVQGFHFKEELAQLKTKETVAKTSQLLSLSPFLDEQGIIRVSGRLRHSALRYNEKHPILLPPKSSFTQLVIAHEHRKQLHAGVQATLAAIRTRYWLLSARNNVKKHIRQCITCFKAAPRRSETIMGDLPNYRVTPAKPFARSGVDYCGPIHIKSGQQRNAKITKAYISIFICLCTKAIHIELVSDLTTDAFLNALKKFVARRGKVSHVFSVNGTNFQGASNQLKELHQLLHSRTHQEKVDRMLKEDNIEWHFIQPHAPHFGGIWESAVKSAKYHLKRIVGDAALNFEEMYTALALIEAVLNSRP